MSESVLYPLEANSAVLPSSCPWLGQAKMSRDIGMLLGNAQLPQLRTAPLQSNEAQLSIHIQTHYFVAT